MKQNPEEILSKLIIKNFFIYSSFKGEVVFPLIVYTNAHIHNQNPENLKHIIDDNTIKEILINKLTKELSPYSLITPEIDEVEFKVSYDVLQLLKNGSIYFTPQNNLKKQQINIKTIFSNELNKKRTFELFNTIKNKCEIAFPVFGYWGEHEYSVIAINTTNPDELFDIAYKFLQDYIIYAEYNDLKGEEVEINILTNNYYKKLINKAFSQNKEDYLQLFTEFFKIILNKEANINNINTLKKIDKYFSKIEDELASVIYDTQNISKEDAEKLYAILKQKEEDVEKNIAFTIKYDIALYERDDKNKNYKKSQTFKKMSIRHNLSISKLTPAIPHKEFGFSYFKKNKSGHFMNLSEKLKNFLKNV